MVMWMERMRHRFNKVVRKAANSL
jgi:hypothetical protein